MSRTVAPKKPRTAGAPAKPLTPLPELAAVVSTEPLARTAVVSRVWDHIRAHGLQDATDKRTIIVADDKLRVVFGEDRATVFEMQKLLSPHLVAA